MSNRLTGSSAVPVSFRRTLSVGLRRGSGRRAGRGDVLLAVPAVALVAMLTVVPGLYALYRSFFDWQPGYASPFVGLTNYRTLLSSESFHAILRNHGVLILGAPLWTIGPLVVAVLMYEGVRGAGFFRSVFLFPSILSPAVVGVLFAGILRNDGLLNRTLDSLGLHFLTHQWLENPDLVKPVLIMLFLWSGLGTSALIFSAALAALPTALLEAATMDGASWSQRFRHIILPLMARQIVFVTAFNVITVFLYSFGWIYAVTAGGPGYASTTIDYDIWQNALRFGFFGLAAAESVVLLLIVLLLGTASWAISRFAARRAT